MKALAIFSLFFISLSSFASLKVSVALKYSESAEVIEILDHLVGERSTINPEYLIAFKKIHGITETDRMILERYKSVRTKYNPKMVPVRYSAFSPRDSVHPILEAFYYSDSVDKALVRLQKTIDSKDVAIIADTLKHFKERISKFVVESKMFKGLRPKFEKELRKIKLKQIAGKSAQFFKSTGKKLNLNFFLVWWPTSIPSQADIVGNSIIYRVNPLNATKVDGDKLAMETVRLLSSLQSDDQKANLEKLFFSICPLKNTFRPIDMLEAPILTGMSRIQIAESLEKKDFNLHREWSVNPWISFSSKHIYGTLISNMKNRQQITDGIVRYLGETCREVSVLHNFLKSAP